MVSIRGLFTRVQLRIKTPLPTQPAVFTFYLNFPTILSPVRKPDDVIIQRLVVWGCIGKRFQITKGKIIVSPFRFDRHYDFIRIVNYFNAQYADTLARPYRTPFLWFRDFGFKRKGKFFFQIFFPCLEPAQLAFPARAVQDLLHTPSLFAQVIHLVSVFNFILNFLYLMILSLGAADVTSLA